MTDDGSKKGLKSTGGAKPLRSRGYLSQPGGGAFRPEDDGKATDPTAYHRSRGSRQVSASSDGKPGALDPKPAIKPYRLEDR